MEKDFSFQRDKKIVLKEKGKTHLINLESIICLTCEGYLTTIHFDDKFITVSKLLKHFEIELLEFGFIRVNHNTIINTKNILSIIGSHKRLIVLANNNRVRVSRRKMCHFKSFIENNIPVVGKNIPVIR